MSVVSKGGLVLRLVLFLGLALRFDNGLALRFDNGERIGDTD